jgi:Ca2+:H+ antiporter
LDLIFTPFEVGVVTISVPVIGFVAMDGKLHRMESVMLAMAFFLPA